MMASTQEENNNILKTENLMHKNNNRQKIILNLITIASSIVEKYAFKFKTLTSYFDLL